jgi:quercetin dioxygenase-like cupin family protein
VQAKSTVFIDNERTRVTEWRFAPGASTGWHRHEYDYVVVPMLDGKLGLSSGENESQIAELSAGVPYFRKEGVEHDVTNVNDFEYAFIEVEFK